MPKSTRDGSVTVTAIVRATWKVVSDRIETNESDFRIGVLEGDYHDEFQKVEVLDVISIEKVGRL